MQVKRLVRFTVSCLLFGALIFPAQAVYTSFYVFGDGVCTTTENTDPAFAPFYYGHRWTNGKIWTEDLAQLRGWTYTTNHEDAYFGYYSSLLVPAVSAFVPPADVNTALFVVWVNDADMFDAVRTWGTDDASWNTAIADSLANHLTIIQTLYAKGVRTLIMPNAVDVTKVPDYSDLPSADKAWIRQKIQSFNTSFNSTLNQARSSCPGLTIYVPDFFSLLDSILANPASYGFTKTYPDALSDPALTDQSLNGPGANYVFWDPDNPTAKAHAIMANTASAAIPLPGHAQITKLTLLGGNNRLDVINIPLGHLGYVDSSPNLLNWTTIGNITGTSATQSIYVPASASPLLFYRVRF